MTLFSDIFEAEKQNAKRRENARNKARAADAAPVCDPLLAILDRSENRRRELLAACIRWDGNGIWTDADCRSEGEPPHTTSGLWDILCDLAVEEEWTAENWTALGLDVPDFSGVYQNVAERAEAEVSRLAAIICGDDDGNRPINLKLLSAACQTLDAIEDRYGLWN